MAGARSFRFETVRPDGTCQHVDRDVAVEAPIAIEFNGIGYAVMMATPHGLHEFVLGFALSERLVDRAEEIVEVEEHVAARGIVLRATIVPERLPRVVDRVRHRVADSSCGLCGIENLEQALRPLTRLADSEAIAPAAVFRAISQVRTRQALNLVTGAVHAAALCRADGEVTMLREDVGRHNAFDKLIGAMALSGEAWTDGFALLTARCSYELVEKAALARCPRLVTMSAPTSLAVERAAEANIRLVVLARDDAYLAA